MLPAKYIRIFRKLDSELSSETHKVIRNKVPLSSKAALWLHKYCEASNSSAASGMCFLYKAPEPWRQELQILFLHPFLPDEFLRFPFYAPPLKNLYHLCSLWDSQSMNIYWIQWRMYGILTSSTMNSNLFLSYIKRIFMHITPVWSLCIVLLINTWTDFLIFWGA